MNPRARWRIAYSLARACIGNRALTLRHSSLHYEAALALDPPWQAVSLAAHRVAFDRAHPVHALWLPADEAARAGLDRSRSIRLEADPVGLTVWSHDPLLSAGRPFLRRRAAAELRRLRGLMVERRIAA